VKATATHEWIVNTPETVIVAGLAIPGKDYLMYLADSREVSDPAAGKPIPISVSLDIPPDDYDVRFYSPTSGKYLRTQRAQGGKAIDLGSFTHDLALRISRRT
jgi:hypothetical protein